MRRGQGAGAVEVKGKKSEVGGAQSAGQRALALGSVGSPGVLLGQDCRVHPDRVEWVRAESGSRPLRALRAPRLHLPSLLSHPQPLAILGHPEGRETEEEGLHC